MKNLLITLILLLLYSCKSTTTESSSDGDKLAGNNFEKHGSDVFFEINYEDVLKNSKAIHLSQIASDVEYVKLETNNKCMIRRFGECYFTDSLIFIGNQDHVLEFSRDGKFQRRIGSPGRGPGEIDLIRTISILPDKKMIAIETNANRTMLYFSFDGKLIKTVKIPDVTYIKVMNDGRYIVYDDGAWGSNKYSFSLTKETGDTISRVRNYCNWINTSGGVLSMGTFPKPFKSQNIWFFKDKYNDTIYTINSNAIRPSYAINLGKFKLPDELRPERLGLDKMQQYRDKALNHYFLDLFEASDKLFIVSYCYHNKGGKKYLIYDKKDKSGIFLDNGTNISTGFINDWDGGMDFWPIGSAGDNQVFMPVSVMTFQKIISENSLKPAKYPEKQKELEKIVTGMDVSDNPVLVVATIK